MFSFFSSSSSTASTSSTADNSSPVESNNPYAIWGILLGTGIPLGCFIYCMYLHTKRRWDGRMNMIRRNEIFLNGEVAVDISSGLPQSTVAYQEIDGVPVVVRNVAPGDTEQSLTQPLVIRGVAPNRHDPRGYSDVVVQGVMVNISDATPNSDNNSRLHVRPQHI